MGEPVIHTSTVLVRYQETDQMGVAHHSVYPVWFEAARTAFIRDCGMPYGKMEQEGFYLPLLELKCKFRSYSRYEDELTIKTRVSDVTRTRLYFEYEVIKEDHRVATGSTMHIYANRALKPVDLLKYRPDLYELFLRIAGRERQGGVKNDG